MGQQLADVISALHSSSIFRNYQTLWSACCCHKSLCAFFAVSV